jgi:hypothetical protein
MSGTIHLLAHTVLETFLLSMWDGDSVLFRVIYDRRERWWIVDCVDTSQWITNRFRGGHRSYHPEVWRDQ